MFKLYTYRYVDVDEPNWEPLRWAAKRSGELPRYFRLDPDPFMYMGHLMSQEGEPDLHLYKHYVSRCYLNVDERHRLFVYMWSSGDDNLELRFTDYDVHYKKLRGLAAGLDRLSIECIDPDDQWHHRRDEPDVPNDVVGNVVPLRRADTRSCRQRSRPWP